MVKKYYLYIILFFFLFFIPTIFPNALTLGYPSVYYYENGNSYSTNAHIDTWGTTEYYVGPNIGRISPAVDINRVDYNWFNAGLCPNKNISIKFRLAGTVGFFSNVNWGLSVYNNNQPMTCSYSNIDGSQIDVSCYSDVGGGTLSVYLTTNVNYPDYYHTAISRNFEVSCDVSNEAIVSQSIENTQNIINNQNSNTNSITNNQNQNTQNIINNQNSNTNSITNNQNQNTQNIINNQNQNTQQEIESQKVCRYIDNSYILNRNVRINGQNGQLISSNNIGVTNFININSGTTIKVASGGNWGAHGAFYDSSKNFISSFYNPDLVPNSFLTIPSNAAYVRFSIQIPQNIPNFVICNNGNQALTDSLTDTSAPDSNSAITDMENMTASDTPISDLITMPLTLLTAYINGMNSTCTPYNAGSLYGTDIIFPCINIEQRIGSNLWSNIDMLFCLFMCYNIGMLFITAFDSVTSLKDEFNNLYTPRHADTGYQPKHGG